MAGAWRVRAGRLACTFITTSSPVLRSVATCAWPMEAAPHAVSLNSEKSWLIGPKSSSMTCFMSDKSSEGTSDCSCLKAVRYACGTNGLEAAACPNLMYRPRRSRMRLSAIGACLSCSLPNSSERVAASAFLFRIEQVTYCIAAGATERQNLHCRPNPGSAYE